jgi:hypothetical protein
MINKFNNDRLYDLSNLMSIIIVLESNDIIIIPHNVIPEKFIVNNDANISYRSSLFTYLYKTDRYKKYIIHLEKNDEYKIFCQYKLPYITPHDIYSECFGKL